MPADKDLQIQLLQQMLEQQQKYIESLEARNIEQEATIADLRSAIDELRSLKANLEETIAEFRRKFFGTGSEKTPSDTEPSSDRQETQSDDDKVNVNGYTRPRKNKSKRNDMYPDIPVRDVICKVPEKDRYCPYCNAPMVPIANTFIREELRIIPARVERVRYLQETLICPECRKDGDGTIIKADAPASLMKHSPLSPSIGAFVIFHKIFMNTPYYRQETAAFQYGIKLPRETMANWLIYCGQEYFLPIFEKMHSLLLNRDIIHADETTCQVLREENKTAESTSYMWIYASGSDGLPKIILYDYQPGRAGAYPREFLAGFSGLLQCDGYQGYNAVEDVILVCCMAHCRRKFFEAVPAARRKKLKLLDINSEETIPDQDIPAESKWPDMIPAEIGLAHCNKLFHIEQGLKALETEERSRKRRELETPVWDSFWKWLATVDPLGGSKLAKAVTYANNHKDTLVNYMLDGKCEISNNRAERCAKSYAIGRKNSLFHTSVDGAQASAVMYSIVETAKANGLNVLQYLYMVLLYMPDYKNEPAGIEQLLPWSEFMKEYCTGPADFETITPENHAPLPL